MAPAERVSRSDLPTKQLQLCLQFLLIAVRLDGAQNGALGWNRTIYSFLPRMCNTILLQELIRRLREGSRVD
jgi:hypothetical protein